MFFVPYSSKHLVSRCLDPQTPPEKAFKALRGPNTYSQGIWRILGDQGLPTSYTTLHEYGRPSKKSKVGR